MFHPGEKVVYCPTCLNGLRVYREYEAVVVKSVTNYDSYTQFTSSYYLSDRYVLGLPETIYTIDVTDTMWPYSFGNRRVFAVKENELKPYNIVEKEIKNVPTKNLDYFNFAITNATFCMDDTPKIERVIFGNPEKNPVTVVYWKDGTKTWVKCCDEDKYSKWSGLALCYVKKMICDNDTVKFHKFFKEYCDD